MWDLIEPSPDLAGLRCEELAYDGVSRLERQTVTEYDEHGTPTLRAARSTSGVHQRSFRHRPRYDEQGRLVELLVLDPRTHVPLARERWTYRSDEDPFAPGAKLEWARENADGDLVATNLYLHEAGRLREVIATDETDGLTMVSGRTWDERGRLVKRTSGGPGERPHVTELVWDDDDRLVLERHLDPQGRCTGEYHHRYEGGRHVGTEHHLPGGELYRTLVRRYDEHGRPIEERVLAPDGKTVWGRTTWRYEIC